MAQSRNTVAGTAGDDTLFGASGADEVFAASAGFDTIDGRDGDDWFVAGSGFRVSVYFGDGDPALFPGQVWKFDAQGFYAGFDLFARIRHVAGGAFQDVIFLNWQDNTLDGGAGGDLLDGGAGRDRLVFDLSRGPSGGGGGAARGVFLDLSANAATDPWGDDDFVANVEDADGTPLDDVLIGDWQGNHLRGLGGADALEGRMGDDTLEGGAGADVLRGGLGDDRFAVDDAGDEAHESADEGWDEAYVSAASWALPEGSAVEWVRLLVAGRLDGNGLNNALEALGGPAELNGGGGNDTLLGAAGDDVLRGGAGADWMEGGLGDDAYEVSDLFDRVVERAGEGFDRATVLVHGWRAPDHLEEASLAGGGAARLLHGADTGQTLRANPGAGSTLLAGAGDDTLIDGALFADTLDGGAGDDTIRAFGGADLLRGGAGGDAYDIRDRAARVEEAEGAPGYDQAWVAANDWVAARGLEAVYLAMSATRLEGSAGDDQLVANPLLGGTLRGGLGHDILWGSGLSDTLEGGEGNDILRGQGGGASGDWMIGGPGDDQAVVFSSTDTFVERAGEGADTAWVLADGWRVPTHVELAYLAGGATFLQRGAGGGAMVAHPLLASTLVGHGGQDFLYGGAGDDTLVGNGGNDQFHGGGGADVFRLGAGATGYDYVFHFDRAGGDRLDLRGHASSFGQLQVVDSGAGARVVLPSGFWVELVGVPAASVTAADVWL